MLLVDLCNCYYDDIDGFLFQVIDKVQEETKNRTGIVRSFFFFMVVYILVDIGPTLLALLDCCMRS